MIRPSWCTRDD